MKVYTIKDIIKTGKSLANNSSVNIPPLEIGEHVAQGDINFIAIPKVPENAILIKNPDLQLAPGTSKGSRHCLNSTDNVRVYKLQNPNSLQEVVLEFMGETIITHPEHGNQIWNEGLVLVAFQRQFAKDIRRVND